MNEAELLPCPFCGNDDPYFERTGTPRQSCIVECGNCGCRHESSDEGDNSGQSWNERAAMNDAQLIEHLHARGWSLDKIDVAMIREGAAALQADAIKAARVQALEDAYNAMFEIKGCKVTRFDAQTAIRLLGEDAGRGEKALNRSTDAWREGLSLMVEAWDRYVEGGRTEKAAVDFVTVVNESRRRLAATPAEQAAQVPPEIQAQVPWLMEPGDWEADRFCSER